MRSIDADALKARLDFCTTKGMGGTIAFTFKHMVDEQPTVTPEPHEIGYDDCANALLKMWMNNVLTDGEYYRIADKLNEKWGKKELPEPFKGVTT